MKLFFLTLVSLLTFQISLSQNNKLWKGYFSYNAINDLSQSDTKIFAATENAIFNQNFATGNIKTVNTIDGLSGLTISALYHSPTLKKTLVGYENGLLIVINEIDGSMLNVVDIINKSIPQSIKKVNHFTEYNGIIYVSCDFGIVQYNLNNLQFGDTYFIGYLGAQINILQTTIFNGKIYAATRYNGILRADINNPNLNDYNQWTTVIDFGWSGIASLGTNLLATTTNGTIVRATPSRPKPALNTCGIGAIRSI